MNITTTSGSDTLGTRACHSSMGNRQTVFFSKNDTRRAVEQDVQRATQRLGAMTSYDHDVACARTARVPDAALARAHAPRRTNAEESRAEVSCARGSLLLHTATECERHETRDASGDAPKRSTNLVSPPGLRGVPMSAAQHAQQCLSRGGRPLIRDELIAIVLTIQPDFSLSMLQSMRVEDLNKQIRALVVNVSLDKLGLAESEDPN